MLDYSLQMAGFSAKNFSLKSLANRQFSFAALSEVLRTLRVLRMTLEKTDALKLKKNRCFKDASGAGTIMTVDFL